jgi:hypothetical protein
MRLKEQTDYLPNVPSCTRKRLFHQMLQQTLRAIVANRNVVASMAVDNQRRIVPVQPGLNQAWN